MIWDQDSLYQILNVSYHITKLYLVNNEFFFFTNGAPYEWSDKKSRVTEQRRANVQMSRTVEVV